MPRPPDRLKTGDPIREPWLSNFVDFVRLLGAVVQPPLRLIRSGKGATLTLDDIITIRRGTIPANTAVAAGASVNVTLTQTGQVVSVKNKEDDAIPSKTTARKCQVYVDEYGDWAFLTWNCN